MPGMLRSCFRVINRSRSGASIPQSTIFSMVFSLSSGRLRNGTRSLTLLAAIRPRTKILFQVVLGQINRELGDKRGAAPGGPHAGRIDRRERAVEPGRVIAGKGVAIALVQVGIEVAQVKRKLLPRECNSNIPV